MPPPKAIPNSNPLRILCNGSGMKTVVAKKYKNTCHMKTVRNDPGVQVCKTDDQQDQSQKDPL